MSDLPALRRLHHVWLAFMTIVVLLAGSLAVIDLPPSSVPTILSAALAAVAGVSAIVTVIAIDRTFAAAPPTSDLRALRGFETRQALQFAVSLAPAVLGVALAAALGSAAAAAVGVMGALGALARARPTTARLHRIEATWTDRGADISALRAGGADRNPDANPGSARPTDPPTSTSPND